MGRFVLYYCTIVYAYKILHDRSDFNLYLQSLALNILIFRMLKVAVSNRS